MYSGTTAGGARRLIFVNPKQGPIWNKYIVGSGVGAVTRSNRAAYKKRANNNAQQKPCCTVYPQNQPRRTLVFNPDNIDTNPLDDITMIPNN